MESINGTVKTARNGKTVIEIDYSESPWHAGVDVGETIVANGQECFAVATGSPFSAGAGRTNHYVYVSGITADTVASGSRKAGTGNPCGLCAKCGSYCCGDCSAN